MWRDAAIGYGAVALLYLPWLPTLIYQAKHTGAPWDAAPVFWSVTQGAYAIVGGRGAAMVILLAGGSGLFALRRLQPPRARELLSVLCLLTLGFGTLLLAFAYSKISPAWADRYLAVTVGPLMLLTALGLTRAGRMGIVGLVLLACFWVLDPIPTRRYYKSNAALVAANVRPDMGPGSLIVSTQPEQVPTLSYYLPRVTRFGTTLGPVPDPHIVDWRNALTRMEHASVRRTLTPMVNSVTSGQHLLLVIPLDLPKVPLWMQLIQRDSLRWVHALEHDPSLRLIRVEGPDVFTSGVPVRGFLFVKQPPARPVLTPAGRSPGHHSRRRARI